MGSLGRGAFLSLGHTGLSHKLVTFQTREALRDGPSSLSLGQLSDDRPMYEEELPNYSMFCWLFKKSQIPPNQWERKNQLMHLSRLCLFLSNNNFQLQNCAGGLKFRRVQQLRAWLKLDPSCAITYLNQTSIFIL